MRGTLASTSMPACVRADQRDRHERLTRCALRPPVSQERLEWTATGQVRLELRRPWSDGTTHLLFDPVELLERLAALVPRPRINLILYHGVLAPPAACRAQVVQYGRAEDAEPTSDTQAAGSADGATRPRGANYLWAELMQRTMGLDVLECARCRGRLRLRVRRPRPTDPARRPARSACACGSAVRLDLPPAGPHSPLTLHSERVNSP